MRSAPVAFWLGAILAATAVSSAANKVYVVTTIDYPGAAVTDIRGINNVGQIAGYAGFSNGTNFGFIYQGGAYIALPPPSPVPGNGAFPNISVVAINDLGVMAGSAADNVNGTTAMGLVAVQDQAFATAGGFALGGAAYAFFSHPGYNFTEARAIGNSGLVTGWANNNFAENSPGLTTGFIYDPVTNSFTDIFFPTSYFTLAQGINGAGQVVGSVYFATKPHNQSFVRDVDGTVTFFTVNGGDTQARGINDAGLITGFTGNSTNGPGGTPMNQQTFVGNTTNGFQLIGVAGAQATTGEGINNAGQVVGPYIDAAGNFHGFLATPVSQPSRTTASGAFMYQEPVVANIPIFVAPAVATGFSFATGTGDPLFASVTLPVGIGQAQFALTVAGQSYGLYGGDEFDFATHGFPDGVDSFSVTGIDTSAFSGAANAQAFPIELSFVANGTFTGTQTPLGP